MGINFRMGGMVCSGGMVNHRSVIARGSVNRWAMVGRGGVDHWGMVGRGGVDHNRSNLDHWSRGMVGW